MQSLVGASSVPKAVVQGPMFSCDAICRFSVNNANTRNDAWVIRMKKIRLTKPPPFLTHHVPLRADRMARLTLPSDLTTGEATRLAAIVQALVTEQDYLENGNWPYPCGVDPDGDLDAVDIQASFGELALDDDDHRVAVVQSQPST